MVGTILDGRYRILKRIGSGGMGEVFLGEHLLLRRREAIKVLKPRFINDEPSLARFRREARATNRVQHPNIVAFYDFGMLPDGRLYLTMEFVDGLTLQHVLKREGRFTVGRSVAILRQLASAVSAAHEKGVVHRDLKPQNLVLAQESGHPDRLKVLDFGIAKIIAPGYYEESKITSDGQLFGTPGYVAPEQIRGVRDDLRIDIYAIGCIAYEILTGSTPFVGRPLEILDSHLEVMPLPPSACCPEAGIPRELDAIVLRCLEKRPMDRYQQCQELALALAQVHSPMSQTTIRTEFVRPRMKAADTIAPWDDSPRETTTVDPHLQEEEGLTTDLYTVQLEAEYRQVLRSLAEAICDLGFSNPTLLVLLADVHQAEQELAVTERELADLQHSSAMVSQKARELDASLRFALGELHFDRDSHGKKSPLVGQAIILLTKRLADIEAQTQERHAIIVNQQIDKTALREDLLESLRGMEERLDEAIEEGLPESLSHGMAGLQARRLELAQRLRGARTDGT